MFVAFDTETTGLKAETDFIIEIGAVKFTYNGEIARFDKLIKPPCPILPFIQELTGITNETVAQSPGASVVLPDFLRFIGSKKTILLAHNAPFDAYFVNSELERLAMPPLSNMIIDTLPLARWAYPTLVQEEEKGQYKLQSLAKRFGIHVLHAHRADDDARVLTELFLRILNDTLSVQKNYEVHSQNDALFKSGTQLELFAP